MYMNGVGSTGMMFTLVPIFIGIIFIVVIGTIIGRAVNYGTQKTKPETSVAAKVVSKRQHVWGDRSHTNYYATFELESGERIEYQIPNKDIGYIVEGDYGILTHQGTLFTSFTRDKIYAEYE